MKSVLTKGGKKRPTTPARPPSARSLLFALVAAIVVPIFLFSAWLIVLQGQDEMDDIEEHLLNTAQAIATDVDREVVLTINALQTLALGFDLDTSKASEFQELSNRMLSTRQSWRTVIVRDPSGKPLASILRKAEKEAQLPDFSLEGTLGIFKTERGEPIESPLASLLGSSIGVHVPIRIREKTAYIASVLLDPQIFADLLTQHKISSEWLVSILDPKKIVVASTRFADKLFGKPTKLLLEETGHSMPGRLFRSKIDNVPSYVVLGTAPVSGWSVVLAVPAAVVEAPFYRTIWLIIGAGLLCLGVGITLAYVIGRKVARPLERLAEHARDRAQGKPVESPQAGSLAEVEKINDAFDESSRLLKERQRERDEFHEQLDVRLNELTRLHELSTSLLAIDDRQALFNEIVAGMLILLETDQGSLQLVDRETQRLELTAQIGFATRFPELFHGNSQGQGLAGTAVANRRLLVVEDIERSSRLNDQQRTTAIEADIRAAVAVPLAERRGEIIGVLSAYFSQPWKPSQWQEILLDLYAQYCVNVIQQMHAKEDLQTQNNGLEERVNDHARELERAYLQRIQDLTKQKELEQQLREAQKMKLVGTLASGVAHDFNNILNIILGHVSLLESEDGKKPIAPALQVIKETVQRGASVVKQLLVVARKTQATFEPTDLNSLIRGVTGLLAQTFPKNIKIAVEFDPRIPLVMLDSNQITQAVINLCVNARDAMPDGGKLSIGTQYVDVTAAKQRFSDAKEIPYACVSVADTGTGIQNEAKEHVFEPFFTTKEPGRGTGLGLSVVYGIVQSHEGFVRLDSELGQGTTFHLYFPIKEAGRVVPGKEEPSGITLHPGADGTKILIVEDEPKQLGALRSFFEKEGYTVFTAAEGDSALEIFRKWKDEIEAVFMDLGLPGPSGWKVFQKIKAINPAVKVLFATGYVLADLDREKVERDSYGVVMKPYSLAEVREKVAAMLKP